MYYFTVVDFTFTFTFDYYFIDFDFEQTNKIFVFVLRNFLFFLVISSTTSECIQDKISCF